MSFHVIAHEMTVKVHCSLITVKTPFHIFFFFALHFNTLFRFLFAFYLLTISYAALPCPFFLRLLNVRYFSKLVLNWDIPTTGPGSPNKNPFHHLLLFSFALFFYTLFLFLFAFHLLAISNNVLPCLSFLRLLNIRYFSRLVLNSDIPTAGPGSPGSIAGLSPHRAPRLPPSLTTAGVGYPVRRHSQWIFPGRKRQTHKGRWPTAAVWPKRTKKYWAKTLTRLFPTTFSPVYISPHKAGTLRFFSGPTGSWIGFCDHRR